MADKPGPRGSKKDDLAARIERLESLIEKRKLVESGSSFAELDLRIAKLEKVLVEEAGRVDEESTELGSISQQPMRFCKQPISKPREFGAEVSAERARLIRTIGKQWLNGTKLRYAFFENGPEAAGSDQKEIVRNGFEVWRKVGIGIIFEETSSILSADVRIGFVQGDGAWSYVGRDVRDRAGQNERTMNFGWDLREDPRGVNVAVHEIGHTLGFEHEHQNPISGIVWNAEEVYRYFAGSPNLWDRETTEFNILRKLPTLSIEGSSWDPDSIMQYEFPAGLIQQPERYRAGLTPSGGLTPTDKARAKAFYPPNADQLKELVPFRSHPMKLGPGEQVNFSVKVAETRDYVIQTFGGADTLLVLFDDVNGEPRVVKGDDDSGTDRNARIEMRLTAGTRYMLRLKMYYSFESGETAVMIS